MIASTYVEFSIIIEVMYGTGVTKPLRVTGITDIGFGDSGFVMSMI